MQQRSSPTPMYTIYDLSSETGVPVGTIKRWLHYGLVPAAGKRGADGINYTKDHLRRVRLVKEWRESCVTMQEMAERIAILGEKALIVEDPYAGFDDWEA